MGKLIDLAGRRFGKVTVIERAGGGYANVIAAGDLRHHQTA